jgi:arginase
MTLMQAALKHEIALLGAPSSAGASRLGSERGPAALRSAGLVAELRARGLAVLDRGDLQGPPNPQQPAQDGYRHLYEVSAWARTVQAAVATALAEGQLPLLLGGDHSLAIGSLSAVARHCRATGQHLRVLWLDAHADCNSRRTSPSANLHGMPLACLRGVGPAALTGLSSHVPALEPEAVRLLGVRSVDPGEADLVQQLGLQVVGMATLQTQGIDAVMARALDGLDEHTHLHVSFDVDVLDPGIAPAVSTAVTGGMTRAQAERCMDLIAASGRLGSLDVVELNPLLDTHQHTAALVAELVARLFARR